MALILEGLGGDPIMEGLEAIASAPFGQRHVLQAALGRTTLQADISRRLLVLSGVDMAVTITGSAELTDVVIGDNYPTGIKGTLGLPGTIAACRFVVKRNQADDDSLILLDVSVTPTDPSHGAFITDGSSGPYEIDIDLFPADTALLVSSLDTDPANPTRVFSGVYDIRLTTDEGDEYTPICAQLIRATPRALHAA